MKKSTYSVKTSPIHSIRVLPDRIDWLKNGIPHRTDGPARIFKDGTKSWWKDGRLHRTDGPAYEFNNGDTSWYKDGVLHRTDGPAVEFEDISEWWVEGVQYSEEEFKNL